MEEEVFGVGWDRWLSLINKLIDSAILTSYPDLIEVGEEGPSGRLREIQFDPVFPSWELE